MIENDAPMARPWTSGRLGRAAAVSLLGAVGSGCGGSGSGPAEWFSPELGRLEAEEVRLREELAGLPILFPDQQTERIGYSSKPAPTRRGPRGAPEGLRPPARRVIRLDLGSKQRIDRVVLVPADFAVDANPGAGYGFPVRWRVEVADDPSFEDAVLLADHTGADFPNPGVWPVSLVPEEEVSGRFVRLMAVQLWENQGRSLLALGELMVLQGERNLAAGLPREAIRCTDTDESPRNWSILNLVDSQSVLGAPGGTLPSLAEGYQSVTERGPLAVKWVQVDLGKVADVQEVRLFPARAVEFPARRGYGFPARWRLEGSASETFASPVLLADWTRFDFPNPNENLVVVPVGGLPLRYVRLTAQKLSERFNDYLLALAELEVFSGGRNAAAGATVTASDSREAARWSTRFLTDGRTSQRVVSDWSSYLNGLEQRRVRERALAELPQRRAALTQQGTRRIAGWLLGLACAAAVFTGWAVRRNHRERRRELEALRQRIARDVHDEIGSGLGTIALLSQMAGGNASHPDEARQDFAEINHLSREITESLRDIVWLIRPETRTLGDLAQRLRETASTMLAAVPHDFTVDPAVQGRALPLEFKRQVLLIFKEALHNLMRHAHAHHAEVKVGGDAAQFTLELEDDGRGFHPEAPVSGAGLTGMKQRAATLGGDLAILSHPGQGTRLRLAVPWP